MLRVNDYIQDMNDCQLIGQSHLPFKDNIVQNSIIQEIETSCDNLKKLIQLPTEINTLKKPDFLTQLIDESYADWGWWQLLSMSVLWLRSNPDSNLEQSQSQKLHAVAVTLNDKVAMEFNRRNLISDQQNISNKNDIEKLFKIIVYEHSKHVIELGSQLRKKPGGKKIITWNDINTVCQPIAKKIRQDELNFINLFLFVEILHIRKSDLNNITSSFPWHASYILQPRLLRCSDLMTWICPEYLNAISEIVATEINAEMFIHDSQIPKPILAFDTRANIFNPSCSEPESYWHVNASKIRKHIENLTASNFILSSNQVELIANFLVNLLIETITLRNNHTAIKTQSNKPPFLSLQQNTPLEFILGLSMASIAIYLYEDTVGMSSKKLFVEVAGETLHQVTEKLSNEMKTIKEKEEEIKNVVYSLDGELRETKAKLITARNLQAMGAPGAEDRVKTLEKKRNELTTQKDIKETDLKNIAEEKNKIKQDLLDETNQYCQNIQEEIFRVMSRINAEIKNIITHILTSVSLDSSHSNNKLDQILSNLLNLFKNIYGSTDITTKKWDNIIHETLQRLPNLFSELETILQKLISEDPLRILIDWTLSSILEGLTCSATNITVYDKWQENIKNEQLYETAEGFRQINKLLNETIENATKADLNVSIVSELLHKSKHLYDEFERHKTKLYDDFEKNKNNILNSNRVDDVSERLLLMAEHFIFQFVACLTTLAKYYGITLNDEQQKIADYTKQLLLSSNRSQHTWINSGKEADLLTAIDRLRHELPQVEAALSSIFISKMTGNLLSPLSLNSDLDQRLLNIGDTVLPSSYLFKNFNEKCLFPFVGRDISHIGKFYSEDVVILIREFIQATSEIAKIKMSITNADAAINVIEHIDIISNFVETGQKLDLNGRNVRPDLPWNVFKRAHDVLVREILKSATAATAKAFSADITQEVASSPIIGALLHSNENTLDQKIFEKDADGSLKLHYTELRLCDFARRADYLKQLLCRKAQLPDLGLEPNLEYEFEELHEIAIILDRTVTTIGNLVVDLMDCLTQPESLRRITDSFKEFVQQIAGNMKEKLVNKEQTRKMLLHAIQSARNFESEKIMNEIKESQWTKMEKYLQDTQNIYDDINRFCDEADRCKEICEDEITTMIKSRDEGRKWFFEKWFDKIKKKYQEFMDNEQKRREEHGQEFREWRKKCTEKAEEIVKFIQELKWLEKHPDKSQIICRQIGSLYSKDSTIKDIFQKIIDERQIVCVSVTAVNVGDNSPLRNKKITLGDNDTESEMIIAHITSEPLSLKIPITKLDNKIKIEVDNDSHDFVIKSFLGRKWNEKLLNEQITLHIEVKEQTEYSWHINGNKSHQTSTSNMDGEKEMIKHLQYSLEKLQKYLKHPEKDPGPFVPKSYSGEDPEKIKDNTDDSKRIDESIGQSHNMKKTLKILTKEWHYHKGIVNELNTNLQTIIKTKNIKQLDLKSLNKLNQSNGDVEECINQINRMNKKVINIEDAGIDENFKEPLSQLYTVKMISVFDSMKERNSKFRSEIREFCAKLYMVCEHVKIVRILNIKTLDDLNQIQQTKSHFPDINPSNADKSVQNRIQIHLLHRAADKLFRRKHEYVMRLNKCLLYLTKYEPKDFDILPAINNIDSDAFETSVFVNKINNSWNMEPKELSADFGARFVSIRRNKRLMRNFLIVNTDDIPIRIICTAEQRQNLSFLPPSFDVLPGHSRIFSVVLLVSAQESMLMTNAMISAQARVGNDEPKPIGILKVKGYVERSKVQLSEDAIEFGDLISGSGIHTNSLTLTNNSNLRARVRFGIKCLGECSSGLEVSPTELMISSKSLDKVNIILRCADKADEVKAELIVVCDGADPQTLSITANIQEPRFKIYLPSSRDQWRIGDEINFEVSCNETRLVTFTIENLDSIELYAITEIPHTGKNWINVIDEIIIIKRKECANIRLLIYGREEKTFPSSLKIFIGSKEITLKIFITCARTPIEVSLNTDINTLNADLDWLEKHNLLEKNRLLPLKCTLELQNKGRITSMTQVDLIQTSSEFKTIEENNSNKTAHIQLQPNIKRSLSIFSHLYRFESHKIKCNITPQGMEMKPIECNVNVKYGRLLCKNYWTDFGRMESNQKYFFQTNLFAIIEPVHLLVKYVPTSHFALKTVSVMINQKCILSTANEHTHITLDEFVKRNQEHEIIIPPNSFAILRVIIELKDYFQIPDNESQFLQEVQIISTRELFLGPNQIVYRHRPFCLIMSGTIGSSKQYITNSNLHIENLNKLFTDILSISWEKLKITLDKYRYSTIDTEKAQALEEIKYILNQSFQNRQIQNDSCTEKLIDELKKSTSGLELAHCFIQKIVHTWNIYPVITLLLSQDIIEDSIGVAAACLSSELIKQGQQHYKFIEIVSLLRVSTKRNPSSVPSFDQMIAILDAALRPLPNLFEIFSKFFSYGSKMLTHSGIDLNYIVEQWPWNTNILKQMAISISKAISILFVDRNTLKHKNAQNSIDDELTDFFNILIQQLKPNLNLLWRSCLNSNTETTISISESLKIMCDMIPKNFKFRQEAYLLAEIAKTLLHFHAFTPNSFEKLTRCSIDLLDCTTDEIRSIWKDTKPRWQQCITDLIGHILGQEFCIVNDLLKNSYKWPTDEEELQIYVRGKVGHEIQDGYIQNLAKELFLLKKSLRDGNSSSIINNTSNFIAYCYKIGLIPSSERIRYLNRALFAIERLHNYSQTNDNTAIDIWFELVILCGCISAKWRKSPLWYASEALFNFTRHPSIENALSIFIQGLYHGAAETNCTAFIDQFRSMACFKNNNYKAKLESIFDALDWSSNEILDAQNEYDFLQSLEKVPCPNMSKVAKSIFVLWTRYKDSLKLTSISERFRSVFFTIVETAINDGHKLPDKHLKQLIDAISFYAYEHNSQLFDAIRSPCLILSAMNLLSTLLENQGEYVLSSEVLQIYDKPIFSKQSSILLDRDKLLKYKPSFSFENEMYDNPKQWFKDMIKHDEVLLNTVEPISTDMFSTNETYSDNIDSSGYNKRYENVKKDSDKVSKTLSDILRHSPTSSTDASYTEEHLLDNIVRLSQIVSNWSRSFTNICYLIRNDKHINDNKKSLGFQIIVDGINLLRYLLGLETNFAIFVNDPLSQFIQEQMKILKNKLSSIPIHMLSEELSSQFQNLRIFKHQTDDEDDDTIPVLEGNIYKTYENSRKSNVDYDDPFQHLKHGEHEKILEKITNVGKDEQKPSPAPLESFFSNETIEEDSLGSEEKSSILKIQISQEVLSKNRHSPKNAGMETTATKAEKDSSMSLHPSLKYDIYSNSNSRDPIDNSNVSTTDGPQTSLDIIAATSFGSSTNIISDLIPSKEKIREMLNDSNIYDMYQSGSHHEKQKNPMAVYNTKLESLLNIPSQVWSYQKLASCESISRVIDTICAKVRDQLSDLFSKISNPIAFEWIIMIDNSGSMSIYENYIREALIIILETFRRLECRLAVGRFGNRGTSSQVILKQFDQPLTFRMGQMIFEGLSFCESSHIATGIEALAAYAWGNPETSSAINPKRVALVITDALSKELREDKDQFTDTKKAFNFSIAMLHVRSARIGKKMEGLQTLLKQICNNLCISVDPAEPSIKSLSSSTSTLLILAFQQLIKSMRDSSTSSLLHATNNPETGRIKPISIQSCKQDEKSDYIWPEEELKKVTTYEDALENDGCGSIAKSLCFVNIPTNALPFEDSAINPLQHDKKKKEIDYNQDIRFDCMEKAQKQLEDELKNIRLKSQENVQKVKQTWQQAQMKQSRLITELTNVMEDYVMPCNKFSRRRADFSGPLYLPGLVKAIATDFAYKRIGSSKTAGGKRQYSVVLIIDTSMSMIGHLEHCAMESLLLLTSALIQCGIDNFGIILFGYDVRLLKRFEQPWDEITIYMLLRNFIISQVVGTNDAIAIEYALDMLLQEPTSNIKKIFVLTDGYTTCGLGLTEALVRADSENVEVVGIQVGFERPCVHRFYRDWIIAAIPAALCDAFRYKYRKDNNGPFPSLSDDNSLFDERYVQGTHDDPQKLLENFQREFTAIEDILRTEGDGHLTSGSGSSSMSLDVCFVIDVTGSMTPWLSGVKIQINAITDGITKEIETNFPELDFILRYAVVAYRDEGDDAIIELLKFSKSYTLDKNLTVEERKNKKNQYHDEQSKRVEAFLSKLTACGGEDEPEDVLGALNYVTSLNWEAKVKFAILVCDAPAHGRECNDINNDRFPNGLNNLTVEDVMKKLTEKNIDLMLCHLKAIATEKMAKAFLTHLQKLQPNRNKDELLRQIELYNSSVQEQRKSYHFIFVLDESGSMRGQPWTDLTNAYVMCLKKRIDIAQGSIGDFVSIIQFNDDARITCEQAALSSMILQLAPMKDGGTKFSPALNKALEVLDRTSNSHIPLLLFMSDGAGSGGPDEMTKIYEQYHSRGLQVHTIAFGTRADTKTLKKLADAGKGKFHQSITGVDLANTFVQISAQLTAVDGLINEFAKKVSDAATTKLALEFL